MSTRSCIAVEHADGTVDAIYCHFDGYIEGVGEALLAHHNSLAAAEALVALGDLSVVNTRGGVVAYSRDRGEAFETVKPHRFASFVEYGAEVDDAVGHNGYLYIWRNGCWSVWGSGVEKKQVHSLLNLGAAVAAEREQAAAEKGA